MTPWGHGPQFKAGRNWVAGFGPWKSHGAVFEAPAAYRSSWAMGIQEV